MAQRHEEKYLLDYRQYAALKARAMRILTPDDHSATGSYVITSLYYDDAKDTALLEKQDGLARHTKYRVRTYNGSDGVIKLEKKVKQGIMTEKQSASITREQIDLLGWSADGLDRQSAELALQMQAAGLRPVMTVRYQRDAFFFPGTDLRLTFDTNLEIMPSVAESLFDLTMPGIPVLDRNTVIMEIKYGSFLPEFIRTLTAVSAPQLSVSKYALCRERME